MSGTLKRCGVNQFGLRRCGADHFRFVRCAGDPLFWPGYLEYRPLLFGVYSAQCCGVSSQNTWFPLYGGPQIFQVGSQPTFTPVICPAVVVARSVGPDLAYRLAFDWDSVPVEERYGAPPCVSVGRTYSNLYYNGAIGGEVGSWWGNNWIRMPLCWSRGIDQTGHEFTSADAIGRIYVVHYSQCSFGPAHVLREGACTCQDYPPSGDPNCTEGDFEDVADGLTALPFPFAFRGVSPPCTGGLLPTLLPGLGEVRVNLRLPGRYETSEEAWNNIGTAVVTASLNLGLAWESSGYCCNDGWFGHMSAGWPFCAGAYPPHWSYPCACRSIRARSSWSLSSVAAQPTFGLEISEQGFAQWGGDVDYPYWSSDTPPWPTDGTCSGGAAFGEEFGTPGGSGVITQRSRVAVWQADFGV